MKKKHFFIILFLCILSVGCGYFLLKDKPTQDFPYVIKDGQVFCAEHLGNILADSTLLIEEADSPTFRRPTQAEYDNAVANDQRFMIDAVDKNNSYYKCSRVNFSGTI
jgi:hypothetical protein